MAFTLSAEREARATELISRYPEPRAACIPILHLCQEQEGWVSPDAIAFTAEKLGMTTAQVKGVVTFYTSFHQEQAPENTIWVCRTVGCEILGAKRVQEHLEKRFEATPGHKSKCGKYLLKKAECLAACGQGPMVQINDDYYENLTLEKLDQILDKIDAGQSAAEFVEKGVSTPPPSIPPKAGGSSLPPRSVPPAAGGSVRPPAAASNPPPAGASSPPPAGASNPPPAGSTPPASNRPPAKD